jgi:benzoyl-CoA reductase subunit C
MNNMTPLKSIAPFKEAISAPGTIALDWKAHNGKVIGFRCISVPEEIIWAAGMLPFPLYGTQEAVRLADSYFQPCTCEFVRNIFDLALDKKLSFLDGLVLSNTCDIMKRFYDLWNTYIDAPDAYFINNPQKLMQDANRDYHVEEFNLFKKWIEAVSGATVTDKKLNEAITLYNETRSLLKEIALLRKSDPPLLTGTEAFIISMGATILPKNAANPLLREVLAEIKERQAPDVFGARILVTGTIIDSPDLIEMIEEVDGVVVADDLCTSMRYYWNQVEESPDPIHALYTYMNKRPYCACMHPMGARFDYILDLAHEFKADAVIQFNLKNCQPFLFDAPLLKKELESMGLPISILDVGHDRSGYGQLRTRIQAFIEMFDIE